MTTRHGRPGAEADFDSSLAIRGPGGEGAARGEGERVLRRTYPIFGERLVRRTLLGALGVVAAILRLAGHRQPLTAYPLTGRAV